MRQSAVNRSGLLLAAGLCALFVWIAFAAPAGAETRRLKLYNLHTKERATITFKRNGAYVPSGLKRINAFLRDWRRDEPTKMDPKLLDLVWEVYSKSGSRDYIHVISGYRAPGTNNMLRKRGRGVAKNSLHTLGRALDFFLPDVKLAKLREIGLKHGLGGVGFYPTSGSPFVHMDTGNVRHWPRMERQQLVRMFPDGKTMHVPKDGKPLPGYEQAKKIWLAKRNGKQETLVAEADEEETPNLFARLFQRKKPDAEAEGTETAEQPEEDTENAEATETAEEDVLPANVPIPTLAPRDALTGGQELLIASADAGIAPETPPVPAARPPEEKQNGDDSGRVEIASLTPDDIAGLRASAVPSSQVEDTKISQNADARTVLPGPGTGDQPQITTADNQAENPTAALSFAADAADDDTRGAGDRFPPASRLADTEPYFGPAPSTLELALAANEKSSEATQAIRKLISASRTGSIPVAEAEPLASTPAQSASFIPVPDRNPMKDDAVVVASIRPGATGKPARKRPGISHWALAGDRGLSWKFDLRAPAYGKNAVSGHGLAAVTSTLGGITPSYVPGTLSRLEDGIDGLITASTSSN